MAFGTFFVTIDANIIAGTKVESAVITVTSSPKTIRDPDGDVVYLSKVASQNGASALQAVLELPTDVTTGTSSLIGYTVTVRGQGAEPYTVSFAARPIGTTTSLADLPNDLVPVDPSDLTDAALAARYNDTTSTFRQAINSGLGATYAPRWKASTAYAVGDVVMAPDGSLVKRLTAGTSGTTFSSTNWQSVNTYVGTQAQAELAATFVPQSVIDISQAIAAATITVASASTKGGFKITNNAASYALKIDQSGVGGVYDAVNIAANFAGAHTPVGVVSGNTTLSTVKVTNSAAQTGGAVIAGLGTSASRTVSIFNGENSGSGPTFLATNHAGSTGIAFQATYDAGTYAQPMAWLAGHHTGGNLLYVENDGAQTAGATLRLVQNSTSTTVPIISIANSGTGDIISSTNFTVLNDGRTKVKQIENLTTFNNGQVIMADTGATITRNVADANPVAKVRNDHASSTGDVLQILTSGSTLRSRFNKGGYFMTRLNTVPADADIATSELGLWFDSTTGAAKFGLRGKDAAGTARGINLPMTPVALAAAATDAATTQTLVNDIRSKLIATGMYS